MAIFIFPQQSPISEWALAMGHLLSGGICHDQYIVAPALGSGSAVTFRMSSFQVTQE
jgi:hypothetical protein